MSKHGDKKAALKRSYSQRTLKLLFGLSGNQCAEPSCKNPIIQPATDKSEAAVISQIAHIYELNNTGARSKPGLTQSQLNSASNLILLCPTHHVIVDTQHETYPAELLLEWKAAHERKATESLSRSIAGIGYNELEVAANALMAGQTKVPDGVEHTVIPPKDKIKKNALGPSSALLLAMGAAKSPEVAELLIKMSQLDEGFPHRLRSGFLKHYLEAKAVGLAGDELFAEMYGWASGSDPTPQRTAAGLCLLSHLFVVCDVFEK